MTPRTALFLFVLQAASFAYGYLLGRWSDG
jgi:hypothetical protein